MTIVELEKKWNLEPGQYFIGSLERGSIRNKNSITLFQVRDIELEIVGERTQSEHYIVIFVLQDVMKPIDVYEGYRGWHDPKFINCPLTFYYDVLYKHYDTRWYRYNQINGRMPLYVIPKEASLDDAILLFELLKDKIYEKNNVSKGLELIEDWQEVEEEWNKNKKNCS